MGHDVGKHPRVTRLENSTHRDVVGASHILSRRLLGELGRVQVPGTLYRQPSFLQEGHAQPRPTSRK